MMKQQDARKPTVDSHSVRRIAEWLPVQRRKQQQKENSLQNFDSRPFTVNKSLGCLKSSKKSYDVVRTAVSILPDTEAMLKPRRKRTKESKRDSLLF